MNYWLVVGTTQNWDTAFKHGNIWGLKKTQRHLWEGLNENDKLIFYATKPVGGIIGHGVVRTKFKQSKPLWPDELKKYEVIWPLRFEFDVDFCLPPDKWVSEKIVSKELWPRSGFQLLDQTTAKKLVSLMGTAEYVSKDTAPLPIAAPTTEYVGVTETEGKSLLSHKELQTKLVEIGRLQNYLAEPEYSCDLGRLDVVWRRVTKSVPTYVFEIQVGGDIYQALAKLKDAFDLWNSHIFIVAPESERRKVNSLLSGAFHEIGSRINFIELAQVEELYQRKKNYKDFERELGI
jgi:predicted RNA-binding protein